MKSLATTIRKPYLWAVSVTLTMSLLFTGVVSSVYAIDMGASFTPENEEVVDSVVTDVIISFDNPVYADTTQTVFTGDTLANIITFKTDDANGADIPFSATINPENTAVTVSPTTTLESGTVYIAIADGYYNEGGEQGDAAVATFSVSVPEAPESTETQEATEEASEPEDTTAPTVSAITPGNGEIITDNTRNITITFSEAVFKDTEDGVFDADALATVVMLKTTDASGTDIPFTASISEDNTVITVDPSDNLTDDTVYAGVTDGYYDASDNQGSASGVAFFVSAATQQQVVTPEEVAPEAPESTETQEATEEASEPEDTTAPTVSAITPGNGEIITDNTRNITITFSEAVFRNEQGAVFTTENLPGLITLRTENVNGYAIPFTAEMSDDNTTVTLDPNGVLANGGVYLAISRDYYDVDSMRGTAEKITFTVETGEEEGEEFISKFFSGDLFRLLGGQTIPSVDEAAEGTPPTISQTYTFGMFGNDIRLAQQYLDRTECPIVSAVPGDSENAIIMVGYIDALTQQALRCYQAEKGFEVTGSLTPETFNQLAEEYYLQRSEESDAVNPIVTVVDEYLFNQSIIQQMLFLLRQAVERTGQINEDIVEGEESSDEQENDEQSQEGTPAPTVETEEQVAEEQAAQPPTPNVEN